MKNSLLLVAIAGFCGCASEPLTLAPVGPSVPRGSRFQGGGTLRVYSAVTERNDSQIKYYYPQNYFVLTPEHVMVKAVINSHTMNETPADVNLASGKYVVKAPSDGYGLVYVPVVIKEGSVTEVHLDRRWRPAREENATNLVTFPDGWPVGFKAQ